jgi:predicted dehydrogenase
MVGLVLRFHPGLLRIKQMIDKGAIGRLVAVRAMMGVYLPEGRRIGDYREMYIARLRGGVTLDYLHEIDLVQWVVGATARQVFAFSGKLSDLEMAAHDTAGILLRFDKGVIAEVHLDLFQRAKRRQSEFMGTEGTIIIDLTDLSQCSVQIYRAEAECWEIEALAVERDELFRTEDREFLRCLATRERPVLDGREGKKSLQTALAAIASSEQGKVVCL